jgi:hypothetical protein
VHNAANQGHADVVALLMERHRADRCTVPLVLRGYDPPSNICDTYEELRPFRQLDLSEAELPMMDLPVAGSDDDMPDAAPPNAMRL